MPSVQPICVDGNVGSATWPGGPHDGQVSDPKTKFTLHALPSRGGTAAPSLSSRTHSRSLLPARASHRPPWLPSHEWHGKVRKRTPTRTHSRVSALPSDMDDQCPPAAQTFWALSEVLIPGDVIGAKVKTVGYRISLWDEGTGSEWVLRVPKVANVVTAEPGVRQWVLTERESGDVGGDDSDEYCEREDKVNGDCRKDEDGDEEMTGM